MKIVTILEARPQFIKAATVSFKAMKQNINTSKMSLLQKVT